MMDGKRKPLLARKPSIVIALGGPPNGKPPMETDEEMEGGLTCPKCGMELADTPENREYAAMREDEMDDEDEYEEE